MLVVTVNLTRIIVQQNEFQSTLDDVANKKPDVKFPTETRINFSAHQTHMLRMLKAFGPSLRPLSALLLATSRGVNSTPLTPQP